MNLEKLILKYNNKDALLNTLTIIKNNNGREVMNVLTNVNEKLLESITTLYLTEPSININLNEKYQIYIWKNSKLFSSIHSFDHDKLVKLMKLISYNFM